MPGEDDVVVQFEARTGRYNRQVDAAQGRLRNFTRRGLASLRDFARRGALALTAVAAGFSALVKSSANYVRTINTGARATNTSVRDFQRLSVTLESLGRDGESAIDAMQDLQDRIQELRDGTSTYVEDFGLLNLTVRDFVGLSPDQAVLKLSRAVRDSTDATRAQAAAARILPEFQQIIVDVADAYDDLIPRLERTGGLVEQSNIDRLNDDFIVLSSTLRAQFIAGLEGLADSGEDADDVIAEIGGTVRELTTALVEGLGILQDAINGYRTLLNLARDFGDTLGRSFVPDTNALDEQIAAQRRIIAEIEQRSDASFGARRTGGGFAAAGVGRRGAERSVRERLAGTDEGALLARADAELERLLRRQAELATGRGRAPPEPSPAAREPEPERAPPTRAPAAAPVPTGGAGSRILLDQVRQALRSDEERIAGEFEQTVRVLRDSGLVRFLSPTGEFVGITEEGTELLKRAVERRNADLLALEEQRSDDAEGFAADFAGLFDATEFQGLVDSLTPVEARTRDLTETLALLDETLALGPEAIRELGLSEEQLQAARRNAAEELQTIAVEAPSMFATNLGQNLANAVTSDRFAPVGEALTTALRATFLQNFGQNLGDIFGRLAQRALNALGGAFGGGGGGGGLFGGLRGLIPGFHDGGLYRNPRGEGLALLRDGEEVLTPAQRRTRGGNLTVPLYLDGDRSRITERQMVRSAQTLGYVLREQERENNV